LEIVSATAIYLVIPQRMRLSGTVMEIWRLKDNGVTTLTFCRVATFQSWSNSLTFPWLIQTF